MAILDRYNEFSVAQAFTATGDTPSTNVVDLQSEGDAVGREVFLVVKVATTVLSAGAATVTIRLETDDNSSFSSAKVLFTTAAIGKANLLAGDTEVLVRLPQGSERFLRVVYAVGTAVLTAGAFSAYLTNDIQTND